jgi:small basic protein (TIGR04137 family)
MSLHSSLKISEKSKKHRSVLKKYERLKLLKEKEQWDEKKSIFALPKVKILKIKVRKEKAKEEEAASEAAGVETPVAASAPAKPAAGKPAAESKPRS